jgi:hypothetical protein
VKIVSFVEDEKLKMVKYKREHLIIFWVKMISYILFPAVLTGSVFSVLITTTESDG